MTDGDIHFSLDEEDISFSLESGAGSSKPGVEEDGTEVHEGPGVINFTTAIDVSDEGDGSVKVLVDEASINITESQITDLDHYSSADFDNDLTGKTSDDLSEGTSNLYYTGERVQDDVATALQGQGSTTVTYDDANNTIKVSSTDTDTHTDVSSSDTLILSSVDDINFRDHLDVQDNGNGEVVVDGQYEQDTHTGVEDLDGVVVTDTDSMTFTASGDASIDVTSDGSGGATIDVSATDNNTQRSDEEVQDASWSIASGSGSVTVNYDDVNDSVTISGTDTDTDTHANVSEDGTQVVADVADLNFVASGDASLNVTDEGGGGAKVEVTASDTDITRSDEEIRDVVDALLKAGSNVSLNYDDAADTLTVSSTDTDTHTGVSEAGTEILGGVDDINFSDSGDTSVNVTDDGDNTVTVDISSTDNNTTRSDEGIQDVIGNNVVANGAIAFTYDDSSNELSFASTSTDDLSEGTSNLYYTGERVDDRVSGLLAGGSNITLSYNDSNNVLTISSTDSDTQTGVSQSGTQVLAQTSDINFTASSAASVNVVDDTDGTATVEIRATDTDQQRSSEYVQDEAWNIASGDGSVTVTYDDSNDAVTVEGDRLTVKDSSGAVVSDCEAIEFTASNDATVTVSDNGDSTVTLDVDVQNRTDEEIKDVAGQLFQAGNGLNYQYNDSNNYAEYDIATDAVGSNEVDATMSPTWTSLHTFSGGLDAGGNVIQNIGDPGNEQDAATKSYVDAVETGLDPKSSVRAASTQGISLNSAGNGSLDGVSLDDGDRVLLKDQGTGSENGIYKAVNANDQTTWVRADDADEDSEVTSGLFTFVEEGSTHGNQGFVLKTSDPVNVGSTSLNFVQFSGAGQITAGNAMSKSGDTLNVLEGGIDVANLTGTTNDLAEGASNLYFTSERAQDAAANLITAGSNVSVSYDDSGDSLIISATDNDTDTRTDVSDSSGTVVADTKDIEFNAGSNASINVIDDGDGSATIEISSTDTDTFRSDEEIQDRAWNIASGGGSVTVNYDDVNDSVTITGSDTDTHTDVSQDSGKVLSDVSDINFTASNDATVSVKDDGDGSVTVDVDVTDTDTQLSSEQVQDIIGPAIKGSGATSVSYNDASNEIEISSTDTDSDTHINVAKDGSTVVQSVDDLNFTASDAASVNVSDAGGSQVDVEVKATNTQLGTEEVQDKAGQMFTQSPFTYKDQSNVVNIISLGTSNLDLGMSPVWTGLHSFAGDFQHGHDPGETVTESASPDSFNFQGSEDRDYHSKVEVEIENPTQNQATENVTVELYEGSDTTGVLLASETKSLTISNNSRSVFTFIEEEAGLGTGTYHVEVVTGSTFNSWETTEHTKGAYYRFSQSDTGNLLLENYKGDRILDVNSITEQVTFTPVLQVDSDLKDAAGKTVYDQSNNWIPQARLENDSVSVSPGDGLKDAGNVALGSSVTMNVEPGDFAGTYLTDDGSDNLQVDIGTGLKGDGAGNITLEPVDFAGSFLSDDGSDKLEVNLGNGLEGDGSDSVRLNPAQVAGNSLEEDTATTLGVAENAVGTYEIDQGISITWTSLHTFDSGVKLNSGDFTDGSGNTVYSQSNNWVPQGRLENETVTVAGNRVSLGASVDVDTSDLTGSTDGISEGTSNLYFTSERAQDAAANALKGSTDTDVAYNDSNDTITVSLTGLTQFSTDNLSEGSNLYYTSERVEDDVASALSGSTDTDVSYDDANNSITVSLTGLSQFNTDNLSEGNNLYYTTERVEDDVNTALSLDTGLSKAYDDSNGVITLSFEPGTGLNLDSGNDEVDVTLTPFSTDDLSEGSSNLYYTGERAQDDVAGALTGSTDTQVSYDDANNTITVSLTGLSQFSTDDLSEGSNLYYSDERVDDRVNALVAAGTGISTSYDDSGGSLTFTVVESDLSLANLGSRSHGDLSSAPSGAHHTRYSDEEAQDAVGGILSAQFTYDDTNNTVNLDPHASTSDAHHTRYSDEEAQDAVGTITDSTLTYDDTNNTLKVSDNSLGTGKLSFDTATQTELDNHTGTSNAHHSKTSSASELSDVSSDSVSDAHHTKYSDENAQDAVGSIMTGSGAATVNYDDTNDVITVSATDNDTQVSTEDSGTSLYSDTSIIDFGNNLSVTDNGSGDITVDASTGSSLEVQDDGTTTETGVELIDFQNHFSLSNPTTGEAEVTIDSDAVTRTEMDRSSDMGWTQQQSFNAGIAMGSTRITGLGSPSNANDAATKGYVDNRTKYTYNFATGMTQWGSSLENDEIERVQVDSGEKFTIERLEVTEKGGGSSNTSFTVRFQWGNGSSSTVISNLNTVNTSTITGNDGEDVYIQVDNDTGGTVNASIKCYGRIE
jgi:hypothetical protein